MVKTPRLHCREREFDPWSGNEDPARRRAPPKKRGIFLHKTFLLKNYRNMGTILV